MNWIHKYRMLIAVLSIALLMGIPVMMVSKRLNLWPRVIKEITISLDKERTLHIWLDWSGRGVPWAFEINNPQIRLEYSVSGRPQYDSGVAKANLLANELQPFLQLGDYWVIQKSIHDSDEVDLIDAFNGVLPPTKWRLWVWVADYAICVVMISFCMIIALDLYRRFVKVFVIFRGMSRFENLNCPKCDYPLRRNGKKFTCSECGYSYSL